VAASAIKKHSCGKTNRLIKKGKPAKFVVLCESFTKYMKFKLKFKFAAVN